MKSLLFSFVFVSACLLVYCQCDSSLVDFKVSGNVVYDSNFVSGVWEPNDSSRFAYSGTRGGHFNSASYTGVLDDADTWIKWSHTAGQWKRSRQYKRTYNSNNQMLIDSIFLFQGSIWNYNWDINYDYNNDGNLIMEDVQFQDGTGWKKEVYYTGVRIDSHHFSELINNQHILDKRHIYFNSPSDPTQIDSVFEYYPITGGWELRRIRRYSFDLQGLLIEFQEEHTGADSWIGTGRDSFFYNQNN